MIRRERRQWSLIGAMVATVVAAGVFSVTGAYNLEPANGRIKGNASDVLFLDSNFPVSYTHLTLPTIYSV